VPSPTKYSGYNNGNVPNLPLYTNSLGSLPEPIPNFNNNNKASPLKLV